MIPQISQEARGYPVAAGERPVPARRGSSRIRLTTYGTSSDAPAACSRDLPVCAPAACAQFSGSGVEFACEAIEGFSLAVYSDYPMVFLHHYGLPRGKNTGSSRRAETVRRFDLRNFFIVAYFRTLGGNWSTVLLTNDINIDIEDQPTH
jgi:hypothetical protein